MIIAHDVSFSLADVRRLLKPCDGCKCYYYTRFERGVQLGIHPQSSVLQAD